MSDLKDKLENEVVDNEELEKVTGGGCWFGARFEAPDGHDVGCEVSWYRVQFSDIEFCNKFPSICPIDGNPHDNTGRKYAGKGKYFIVCKKCGHYLDKNGNYDDGWGILAD